MEMGVSMAGLVFIVLGLLVLMMGLVALVLAIIAFVRTSKNAREISNLKDTVESRPIT
jgi:HAMP domain-containing protein